MPDCMSFPDNIMDFIDNYSFEDSDHVYTNGSKLISLFRVKQAIEHYLLHKQEPLKPFYCEADDSWGCGNCGETVGYGEFNPSGIDPVRNKYCPNCGKKVKWDARQ